jgi:hypothetical protein
MGEMTEDMSRLWERFNLMEEEDEEVVALEVEVEPMVNRGNTCVVGKLLADRSVGKEVIKTPLLRAWQPMKGVIFKTLGTNLYLIDFEDECDKIRVMEGRPWTFDGNLVSLADFDGLKPVAELEFEKVPFWVRMYDLPLACMSKAMGFRIGASVGEVLEVDADDEGVGWGEYLRVRIVLDLTKPLSRGRRLKLRDRSIWITFKYEKIPRFCFNCGVIQHGSRGCVRPGGVRSVGEGRESQFGRWLRAGQSGNRSGEGSRGRFNGAWRHFEQKNSSVETKHSEKREEQRGRRDETGEEEDDGDSEETLAAPVGTRGATSALRSNWNLPTKASVNHGVHDSQKRKESMNEKSGERRGTEESIQLGEIPGEGYQRNNEQALFKGNNSIHYPVQSGVGSKERKVQTVTLGSSKPSMERINGGERVDSNGGDSVINAEEERSTQKAKNVYVGQWDSIKEKMVWAYMEGDGETLHGKSLVKGSLHVAQKQNFVELNGKEEGHDVEGGTAMHGNTLAPPFPTMHAQTSGKRCLNFPDDEECDEGRMQTGKRKKTEDKQGETRRGEEK